MDRMRSRARDLRNEATDAERHLWRYLKLRQLGGFRFRRQVPIDGYVADFLCPRIKLIVELDGAGHFDLIGDLGDDAGLRHMPLPAARGTSTPRTRAAFMQWAGEAAVPMLKAVDAMREGMWAGVEG